MTMGKKWLLAVMALTLLFAAGCRKRETTAKSAEKKQLSVTATFYPQYVMLLNITAGTGTEITLLAPSDTGCLHDYQLTTRDMQRVSAADAVVINGAGMETFAEKLLAAKHVIDASKDIALTENNAHIWMSPAGAAAQTENIALALAELDPENAAAYRQNAAAYMKKLGELNAAMHQRLDPYAGRAVVVFHEAFPYLAAEFGFTIAAVIEHEPGTEPTVRELTDTIAKIDRAREQGNEPALFAEKQYPASAAEVIARETGLPVFLLDSAVTGQSDKDAYIQAMEYNAAELKKAFEARTQQP